MAYETGDPKQLHPPLIIDRLMSMIPIGTHSIGFTTTNTILDLYSAPSSAGFIEALREESQRVYAEGDHVWSKHAVSKLYRTDSAIKESMRVSAFGTVTLHRCVDEPYPELPASIINVSQVSAKEGLDIDNIHIPEGTRLGVPVAIIQRDEAYYPSAATYDALRFSRQWERDDVNKKSAATTRRPDFFRTTSQGRFHLPTPSDTFLAFGYGKNTCPGRFYASLVMKLMISYLVQHYDVEYTSKRPAMSSLVEMKLPDRGTQIRIRRRKPDLSTD